MTEIAVLPKDELTRMLEKAARRGAEYALRHFKAAEKARLVTAKEAAELLGVSYSRFMDTVRHQRGFPRPVSGTGKGQVKRWREADILAWIGD